MKSLIAKVKSEKKAILLAHYYTLPEVQEVADFVGDSLALSQQASRTDADIILFAGVHFMAETAKILNPNKKVIIPDISAGCSLADSCPYSDFKKFLENYPDHTVISYINCSAEVKTLSDLIVTSGNAIRIVNSLPHEEKIVFAPDKNLGAYINSVLNRKMVLWDGSCHVHNRLDREDVMRLKRKYLISPVIAHPECQAPVLKLADFIGSTTAMLRYVRQDSYSEYIVATETGIIYELRKQNPEKKFHIVGASETDSCNDCIYMKKNNLENIYRALLEETPELILSQEIMDKARIPIEKMLSLSIGL